MEINGLARLHLKIVESRQITSLVPYMKLAVPGSGVMPVVLLAAGGAVVVAAAVTLRSASRGNGKLADITDM